MMRLTNLLTLTCVIVTAGIVGYHELETRVAKASAPAAPDHVRAIIPEPAPESDVVSELLAPVDELRTPFLHGHLLQMAVAGDLTDAEIAHAKRQWQARLDTAFAEVSETGPRERQTLKPKAKRRPRIRRYAEGQTMYQRAGKIKQSNETYGLPHRKRTSRRIRTSR
jgi:hypothetical protein